VRIDGVIQTVVADFLRDTIERADRERAAAVIVELNTPGGALEATREMFTAMLSARTPVVVYVAPSGARAASAGFFLLMAADVAAMAPGTNTGAAHPVGGQGEDIPGVMGEKVEQDSAATIRSLAARNGRNVEHAEAAVVKSLSYSADEALKDGLIDLITPDLPSLLQAIDGRVPAKTQVAMATAGARVEEVDMSAVQRLFSAIAHPNVAYLLLTLGTLGLILELYNPGAILPGVVGGISIVLAFFALSVLPVNYAGVALILLAVVFFIAEIKVTSYGLLTLAGVVSLVLGSLMLFRSAEPALRVSLELIASLALFFVVAVLVMMTMYVKAHRHQVATGREGLLHEIGETLSPLAPRGKVFVHGEIWNAVATEPVARGARVEVVGVDGMTLTVRAERTPPPPIEGAIA
jgi:membrane-bound serine protease (ClpP class)